MPRSPYFNPWSPSFFQHKYVVKVGSYDTGQIAQEYRKFLDYVQNNNKYGSFVLTPEYPEWWCLIYADTDHIMKYPLAGFCVTNDNELVGMVSAGGGMLPEILQAARFIGAEHLSCYNVAGIDNTMASKLRKLGARCTKTMAYDHNIRPHPRPDMIKSVSFFQLNPVKNPYVWQDAFTC